MAGTAASQQLKGGSRLASLLGTAVRELCEHAGLTALQPHVRQLRVLAEVARLGVQQGGLSHAKLLYAAEFLQTLMQRERELLAVAKPEAAAGIMMFSLELSALLSAEDREQGAAQPSEPADEAQQAGSNEAEGIQDPLGLFAYEQLGREDVMRRVGALFDWLQMQEGTKRLVVVRHPPLASVITRASVCSGIIPSPASLPLPLLLLLMLHH